MRIWRNFYGPTAQRRRNGGGLRRERTCPVVDGRGEGPSGGGVSWRHLQFMALLPLLGSKK
jgi:hypothetical protein